MGAQSIPESWIQLQPLVKDAYNLQVRRMDASILISTKQHPSIPLLPGTATAANCKHLLCKGWRGSEKKSSPDPGL